MNFYFYKHSIQFKNVLDELINYNSFNRECIFIKEDYNNIDELLFLDQKKYYEDEKLYGEYDDWEDYYDSIYM
jgi:hypothetical protein